jgi:hypothetical protein
MKADQLTKLGVALPPSAAAGQKKTKKRGFTFSTPMAKKGADEEDYADVL